MFDKHFLVFYVTICFCTQSTDEIKKAIILYKNKDNSKQSILKVVGEKEFESTILSGLVFNSKSLL
jgi:hypothetical protein